MPKPAITFGPSVLTSPSPTSSTCRTKSSRRLPIRWRPSSSLSRRVGRSVQYIPMRWTCVSKAGNSVTRGRPRNTWRKRAAFSNVPWYSIPADIDALVGIAVVDVRSFANSFSDDLAARIAAAETAAIKALSLAPNHARAHNILGIVYAFTNRVARGIAECERALALDRNLVCRARCHRHGQVHDWSRHGNRSPCPRGAPPLSPRSLGLPVDRMAGIAKLRSGRDAEAVAWLRRCVEANRNYPLAHFYLAAALALLG